MVLGFTGTRHSMTLAQIKLLRRMLKNISVEEFHHGDCVGADAQAHDVYDQLYTNASVVIHPSGINHMSAGKAGKRLRPKPPLERNRDIVDACDLLIAGPAEKDEMLRSGTWATVRYARKISKPILFIFP